MKRITPSKTFPLQNRKNNIWSRTRYPILFFIEIYKKKTLIVKTFIFSAHTHTIFPRAFTFCITCAASRNKCNAREWWSANDDETTTIPYRYRCVDDDSSALALSHTQQLSIASGVPRETILLLQLCIVLIAFFIFSLFFFYILRVCVVYRSIFNANDREEGLYIIDDVLRLTFSSGGSLSLLSIDSPNW